VRAPGTVRAATDAGGTFTDLVYFFADPATGAEEVVTAKADTTPPDFDRGVLDVLRKSGVSLAEIAHLAEGFRDVLEIARGNRPDYFNLHYVKPAPFVPRRLRREVPGRITQDGGERRPLDLNGLRAILDDFRDQGVEAIAICLIHACADPRHEQAVLERVRELWPEVSVVSSHQITRGWREYERTAWVVEIGQCGSIAFGKLHVGPRSAGAVPGPAAYGRGGTEATTTDDPQTLELLELRR
jgi:N-methylhydantoinase A